MTEIECAINNHSTVDGISPYADGLVELLKSAQSRIAELEKDAARYLWLRDICGIVEYKAAFGSIGPGMMPSGENLDVSIDAAMQKG